MIQSLGPVIELNKFIFVFHIITGFDRAEENFENSLLVKRTIKEVGNPLERLNYFLFSFGTALGYEYSS
jgi:hypothetical protein